MSGALPASGAQIELAFGDYRASIASVGATLRSLTFRGRDLVLPFDADEMRPQYRGALLAPWPNRVGGGRYEWQGAQQQLAVTEPERGHALHGLVLWSYWQPVEISPAAATLAALLAPQTGYPFALTLSARYSLAAGGLTIELTARNTGREVAPYGCSIHPYVVAGPGPMDGWTFELPASRRLEVDDVLLPLGDPAAPPADADFTVPHTVGAAQIDHAYTDVRFVDDAAAATVIGPDGSGVRLHFGAGTPWVQVCTSDFPGGHRAGLAVEPMTCPPDAFATGVDVVRLAPGEQHRAWWRLEAVE